MSKIISILSAASLIAFAAAHEGKGGAKSESETITSGDVGNVGDVLGADAGKTLPATLSVGQQLASVQIGGRQFKMKQVTRTVLKQTVGEAIFVKFTGAVYQGEELKGQSKDGKPKMEPARLAEVQNLRTGSLNVIIMNTVLEGELNRLYPDNAYVGREFSILMMEAPEGKRYKSFEIFELEEETAA